MLNKKDIKLLKQISKHNHCEKIDCYLDNCPLVKLCEDKYFQHYDSSLKEEANKMLFEYKLSKL